MNTKVAGVRILCLAVLLLLGMFGTSNAQMSAADPVTGKPMFPGVSYSGPGNPAGDITTCGGVWNNDGTRISGGGAGLSAPGQVCFSGGGQNFCTGGSPENTLQSYHYTCANVDITHPVPPVDISWVDFDVDAGKLPQPEEEQFYSVTTRDTNRGRAGYDNPLFMNAYGICRSVDNTAKTIKPVFMGVSTEVEWRTVHGVPAGGNPNGGYTKYTNDATIPVTMKVCCSPVMISICGQNVPTGYGNVGDVASITAANGFAQIECVANNTWVTRGIEGICEGSGGGGGGEVGRGYRNPNSPGGVGEISAERWDSLSPSTQAQLERQGYGQVGQNTPTNGKGVADIKAAKDAAAAAKADAEKKAAEIKAANEALIEKLKKEAEEAEKKKQEEEDANDDDETT